MNKHATYVRTASDGRYVAECLHCGPLLSPTDILGYADAAAERHACFHGAEMALASYFRSRTRLLSRAGRDPGQDEAAGRG